MNEQYKIKRILDITKSNSYQDGTMWIPISEGSVGRGFWLQPNQELAVVEKDSSYVRRSEQIGLEAVTT